MCRRITFIPKKKDYVGIAKKISITYIWELGFRHLHDDGIT